MTKYINRCCAITNKKKKCKKFCKNSKFCNIHKNNNYFCCICHEYYSYKNMTIFDCQHHLCNKCTNKLINYKCPLCREDIKNNLSDKQIDNIDKNIIHDTTINDINNLLSLQFINRYIYLNHINYENNYTTRNIDMNIDDNININENNNMDRYQYIYNDENYYSDIDSYYTDTDNDLDNNMNNNINENINNSYYYIPMRLLIINNNEDNYYNDNQENEDINNGNNHENRDTNNNDNSNNSNNSGNNN